MNKNAPFKTVSKIETKLNLKLWITPGILNSIKTKNNPYGIWVGVS